MIPQYLYDKAIVSYIDNSISLGYESYSDLCDFDKAELTAKCISRLGTDCYNAIIENDNFEFTVDCFVKYLLNGSHSKAYELAETMRDNAVKYFASEIEELFNERLEEKKIEGYIESGLKPYKDLNNGEVRWTL